MTRFLSPTTGDDAADAARFLSRVGYVVLAIGAPVGVVLSPLALFVMFPIGVALVLFSSILDSEPGFVDRILGGVRRPEFLVLLALLGWAALSVAWAPYPVSAGQHVLKLGALLAATVLTLSKPRENAAAADLYLFPAGVALGMATIAAVGLSEHLNAAPDEGRVASGAVALAVLLFPALGGLAARGRNGLARLLLIIAAGFAYALGDPRLTIGLFAGFIALSLSLSDPGRTQRELSWLASVLILLSPLIPALAPTVAMWVFHAKLAGLPAPYPSLSVAADIFTHDKARLITGHGFETISRSVAAGILPALTPRALIFTIWYELGIVGAFLAAAGAWLAFRGLRRAPPRLAPYLAGALTCNVALAVLSVDFADMTWMTLVAVGAISADTAARSQYRTTRPSATTLANL